MSKKIIIVLILILICVPLIRALHVKIFTRFDEIYLLSPIVMCVGLLLM